ncbi:phosphate ABC transporter substrate-binding protein [Methylomonas sp. AM2-LC]|uniref:phosphate ABC transporter substrate-binding protein n=1 Tax=Methylomonas sp. AM2-LC TaxID=3153301 RepID=UPI0032675F04
MKPVYLFLFLMLLHYPSQAEIVVVVSAKSSVSQLDKEKISAIFLGKTSTFPDGNQAEPIEQLDESTAHDEFHRKVTEKSNSQLKSYWSKMVFSGQGNPPKEIVTSTELLKLIAANPKIIGYIEKSELNNSLKVVFTP